MEGISLKQIVQHKSAIFVTVILNCGIGLVVFNDSLVIQYLSFEQSWALVGEDR